ncbi:integron integrase [bacterium]|nr:integron integrase [bacterium]
MQPDSDLSSRTPKLLDQVRENLRARNYSLKTEKSYISWIRQYIHYHKKRHPLKMGEAEINEFLKYLAIKRKVSASTQNQALCAIVYLYKNVLKKEIGNLELIWAQKPKKLPVVFTHQEVKSIVKHLMGMHWLAAMLMYGSGLRLSECLHLRVKDIDFGFKQIVVNNGKGFKDRITTLPDNIIQPLKEHLCKVKNLHQKDLREGYGSVYMPYALERKYPNASREWAWQFVLPAHRISKDPRSSIYRRHHLHESVLQKAVKTAIRKAGITKHAGCHTFTP